MAKFSKDGEYLKTVGSRGNAPDQFSTPHAITSDAKGNIYVADRGNNRIKVYDPDLNLVKTFSNVRSPWAVCVSPGPTQYVYSADAGGKIYKLDPTAIFWAGSGTLGKKVGQFYWARWRAPARTEIHTGEAQNWRAQKLTLHPAASPRSDRGFWGSGFRVRTSGPQKPQGPAQNSKPPYHTSRRQSPRFQRATGALSV